MYRGTWIRWQLLGPRKVLQTSGEHVQTATRANIQPQSSENQVETICAGTARTSLAADLFRFVSLMQAYSSGESEHVAIVPSKRFSALYDLGGEQVENPTLAHRVRWPVRIHLGDSVQCVHRHVIDTTVAAPSATYVDESLFANFILKPEYENVVRNSIRQRVHQSNFALVQLGWLVDNCSLVSGTTKVLVDGQCVSGNASEVLEAALTMVKMSHVSPSFKLVVMVNNDVPASVAANWKSNLDDAIWLDTFCNGNCVPWLELEIAARSNFFVAQSKDMFSIVVDAMRRTRFQGSGLAYRTLFGNPTLGDEEQLITGTTGSASLQKVATSASMNLNLGKVESREITGNKVLLAKGHSPNGYICNAKAYGRINNMIIVTFALAELAFSTQKTLVAPKSISKLYDVLNLNRVFPSSPYQVVVSYDDSLCNSRSKLVTLVQGKEAFFTLPHTYFKDMYRNLVPRAAIQSEVTKFMRKHNLIDNEFLAVHLRWLEGQCQDRTGNSTLCSTTPQLADEIFTNVTGIHGDSIPIFLAHDHQQLELVETWTSRPNVVTMRNKAKCKMCPVVDFEICARSNAFIGTEASTAAYSIDMLRRHRFQGVGRVFQSVLKLPIVDVHREPTYFSRGSGLPSYDAAELPIANDQVP